MIEGCTWYILVLCRLLQYKLSVYSSLLVVHPIFKCGKDSPPQSNTQVTPFPFILHQSIAQWLLPKYPYTLTLAFDNSLHEIAVNLIMYSIYLASRQAFTDNKSIARLIYCTNQSPLWWWNHTNKQMCQVEFQTNSSFWKTPFSGFQHFDNSALLNSAMFSLSNAHE